MAPYFGNGNMLSYILQNPKADRQQLILQIAEAVDYLHNQADIVHGDLKCENMLVSDNGNAKLADFGLSVKVHKSADSGQSRTAIRAMYTLAFAAPEILVGNSADLKMGNSPDTRSKTMKTDVYALGMTILQACTGQKPWTHAHNQQNIINRTNNGQFHSRPSGAERTGLTDAWWEICKRCWAPHPDNRPTIEALWGQLYVTSQMRFASFQQTDAVVALAFLPGNEKIVVGPTNGRGQVLNIKKGKAVRGPVHTGRVMAIAVSPNGKRAVTSGDDKTVRLWSTESWDERGSERVETVVTSLDFSPDGNYIVLGGMDGSVRIWYANGWATLCKGAHGYVTASGRHPASVESVRFVPRIDRVVASADEQGTVGLWDARTGRPTTVTGLALAGSCVAFAPGPGRAASGALDGTVRVCYPVERHGPRELRGHAQRVLALEFSPDGEHIASASADATVRLWDARSGELVGGPLGGHGAAVTSLAFSPDGRRLASGSQDGYVRVWDMRVLKEKK